MEKMPQHFTDAQAADWHYAHRAEMDAELEHDDEVAVEFAEPVTVTMSFRASAQEAHAIREAAAEHGMSLSEWIRSACETATVGGFDRFQLRRERAEAQALEEALASIQRGIDQAKRAAHVA